MHVQVPLRSSVSQWLVHQRAEKRLLLRLVSWWAGGLVGLVLGEVAGLRPEAEAEAECEGACKVWYGEVRCEYT